MEKAQKQQLKFSYRYRFLEEYELLQAGDVQLLCSSDLVRPVALFFYS